jgi:glycosyltransferase involved in cell wall biosynthesis
MNFFSPVHGGSAMVPYQLSKELAIRGHEVTIYTSDYKLSEEWAKSAQELQIKVFSFRTWLNWVNVQMTPGILKQAKDEVTHFDVIHMHNYRSFQNIVVHHYAKKYNISYVLQAHGSAPRIGAKRRLKQVYDILCGYKLLRDASKVIALTGTEVDQYKGMGISEDKIEIVPNGINLSEFENLPGRGEFRRKHGLSDEQKIILYLGRIHRIKGLDLLARAFADLNKHMGKAKLVIVGPDDGHLPALRKLIRKLGIEHGVLLTGPLYGEDKLEAYVDADVYVLPSIYEAFPNTVLEACACGTPFILTDRCGIADIVNGLGGVVVPYDEDQLQEALLYMLSDERTRQESGECGKLLVREQFNWEKIIEQVEDIYLSCLSSRS